jgi:hypothetical protein
LNPEGIHREVFVTWTRSVALLLLGGAACGATAWNADVSQASSHREAPMIADDAAVDCTDVYAFVSPDDPTSVTLIANYIPLQEPSGGPNYFKFSDTAIYEIHVDNDGDAEEDITFQFEFSTETKNGMTFLYNTGPISAGVDTYTNLNVEQRYTLTRVEGDRRQGAKTVLGQGLLVAPNNVGDKSIADYAPLEQAAIYNHTGGVRSFVGQRDDPFFLDLGHIFDLANLDDALPGGLDSQCGARPDHLAGFNVHSLVLQVPIASLTASGAAPTDANDPGAVIGVWSSASRPQVCVRRTRGRESVTGGARVQVSRLGMPLVNEVVIPRQDKDLFNNSEPKDDGQFLSYVQTSELAGILNALFGLQVPQGPRDDLVTAFLTGVPGLNQNGATCEYLRLNMAIPTTPPASRSRMGVLGGDLDGFPNGRRLEDDTVDIALRVVAGVLTPGFDVAPNNQLGDGVCQNDVPFQVRFPYLAPPHSGTTRQHQ